MPVGTTSNGDNGNSTRPPRLGETPENSRPRIRVLAREGFPERVTGGGLAASKSRGAAQNGNCAGKANNRGPVSGTEIRLHLTRDSSKFVTPLERTHDHGSGIRTG